MKTFIISLIVPLNLCVFLVICGAVLAFFRKKAVGALVSMAGILWVLIWSLPLTSLILGGILENRYPHQNPDAIPQAEAIVVLGGNTANHRENWFAELNDSPLHSRVDTASKLYHAQRAPKIIVSGGALSGSVSEAKGMAARLVAKGVPESAIVLENESTTTYENAKYTASELIRNNIRSIILVTSALHTPRSMAVFERLPLEVTAAPNPPQITIPDDPDFISYLPNARALNASRSIIKEYIGLIVYWFRGWV
ncbi:MAG: YdcF family protein [Alcaligenaceae bacterium]|nr:YdcF family protein [Alcaligenaceae bacterium]